MGTNGDHGHLARVGSEGDKLGMSPCSAHSDPGLGRDLPDLRTHRPATPRGTRRTETRPGRSAGRQRPALLSTTFLVPWTLTASNSAHGPVTATRAARWTTASAPVIDSSDGLSVDNVTEVFGDGKSTWTPLQHRDRIPAADEAFDQRSAQQARRPRHEDLHMRPTLPPARTRSAHRAILRAIDLRVVAFVDWEGRRHKDCCDVCRWDPGADLVGKGLVGKPRPLGTRNRGDDNHHMLRPRWPNTYDGCRCNVRRWTTPRVRCQRE